MSISNACWTIFLITLVRAGRVENEEFRRLTTKDRIRRQLPSEINIQVTAPLFTARLFDFGPEEGDETLPNSKSETIVPLHLEHAVQFYAKRYETLYIHSNGGISFSREKPSKGMASIFMEKAPLIMPFWNRNDLLKGGSVFYRTMTKSRLIDRAKNEVLYQYDRTITISSLVIITWHKMQPSDGEKLPDENTNTFQLVLMIANNETFANFIYKNIGWTKGAEAGFTSGEMNKLYAMPTSGTTEVTYLKEYGNTGIPGEWMFQVDWHRIVRCKAGVKGDTCDTECSEHEWGEDCIHCCFCSKGKCNVATGECATATCEDCWLNPPYCNTYDSKCTPKTSAKCASNAVSMINYDKCGKPSVQCHCLAGYNGDGHTCTDTDECQTDHGCSEKAECVNLPGSYFCQCKAGYEGNGTHCAPTTSSTHAVQELATSMANEETSEIGNSANDKLQLPKRINSHISYTLQEPMVIFGKPVKKLTVSSNGLVTVNGVLPVSPEDPLEMAGVVGFAVYYSAVDLAKSVGSVSVQETSNMDMLNEASIMIARHFPALDFQAHSIVMVAYENVSTANTQDMSNTFLLVLITGRSRRGELMTFADYVYEDLEWTEDAQAAVIPHRQNDALELPGSGTDAIRLLSHSSNIQEPGQWLFRVDMMRIQFCPSANMKSPRCELATEASEHKMDTAKVTNRLQANAQVESRLSQTKMNVSVEMTTQIAATEQTLLIEPSVLRVQLVTQPAKVGQTQPQTTTKAPEASAKTTSSTRLSELTTSQPLSVFTKTSPEQPSSVGPKLDHLLVTMPTSQVKKSPVPMLHGSNDFVGTYDEDDMTNSSSQMAIIIPAAIVGVWLIILFTIGIVVCCRRKMNKRKFRRSYEANYHFDTVAAGSVVGGKRGMIMIPSRSSYESVLTDYSTSTDRKRLNVNKNNLQPIKTHRNGFTPSERYHYFNQSYYESQPEFPKFSYTEKL